jgi:hypothetical protein
MSSPSAVMIVLSVAATLMGLPCCLGWINWFAIPISAACIIVGAIGLATDRDSASGNARNAQTHLAAVIVGSLMMPIGVFRLVVGFGLF